MRSWLLGAVLVACASCDALFGIATIPTGAPADARTVGDDLGRVHGQYLQLWAENDPTGLPVQVQREFPANQLTAIATLDDGTPRAVTIDDVGFSFTTPQMGDHYSLQFAAPSQVRTFDLSASELVLVERTTKRPADGAAPPNTVLALNINGRHFENTAKEEVVTTGTWSRHQIGPSDPIQVDCAAPDSTGAVIDMLSPHDAAYYTSTQPAGGGYVHLTYFAQIRDVTTLPGATATVPTLPLTPQAVTMSGCANVVTHGSVETARELIATGGGSAVNGWFVTASPGLQQALLGALPLANGFGDGQAMAMYGNPYGLPRIDAMASTYASSAAGATSSVVAIAAAGGCTTTTDVPAGQVLLGSNVRVAGTALAATGTFVTVPATGAVDVAFDVSADGDANYFVVDLDQIVGASFTTLDEIVTTAHTVHVPASRFQTTNSYRIRVAAMLGFHGASSGDFMTATEPLAVSQFATPTFRPQF